MYNDYLSKWSKASKKTTAENGQTRTEVLWMNYKICEQMRIDDFVKLEGGESC